MALLRNQTHKDYYEGKDLGNYQFTKLIDIINQFMFAYVGENKIISKISRADIVFHAQRAMQELSFDTFKSIKSQQIDLPASLTMPLPHDYVNYTKISWSDSSGIKHPLYPTNRTSNPFQILQDDDSGDYEFPEEIELVTAGDFSSSVTNSKPVSPWKRTAVPSLKDSGGNVLANYANMTVVNGELRFFHRTRTDGVTTAGMSGDLSAWGHTQACWQELDVTEIEYVDLSAIGTAVDLTNGPGILRVGISTAPGSSNSRNLNNQTYSKSGINHLTSTFDLTDINGAPSYLEWTSTDSASTTKEKLSIDVRSYNTVYVIVASFHQWTDYNTTLTLSNRVDEISVINSLASNYLQSPLGKEVESSTWQNYKSITPSENNNDDYEDDTYWPNEGMRYGLDPQHAQVNGSFYIDPRLGKIHFSSNISGKTVILDYISDGLGTEEEMMVHKFAEEALYKHILCGVMSTRANVGRNQLAYYKKDKFAATRQAKLRLSNIKIEELTQILRGKSKWIKH